MLSRRSMLGGLITAPLTSVTGWTKPILIEKDGIPTSRCETGDPYITFVSAGRKEEGCPTAWFSTAKEAWDKYNTLLAKYKEGRRGTLYWRQRPVLDYVGWETVHSPVHGVGFKYVGRYSVYSRLAISDKPETVYTIPITLKDGRKMVEYPWSNV